MATKEDILEQIVGEYLSHKGYFVRHNVKFRPNSEHPHFIKSKDSNHSDIDVLAINPLLAGPDRVLAVSCKSWQAGFSPKREIEAIQRNKVLSGRERWKSFRELCEPKWSQAFMDTIEETTGQRQFTYVTAVSRRRGDASLWEHYTPFSEALHGNPVQILQFSEMVKEILGGLTNTLASTEVGRLLQMFKAANINTL